MPTTRNRAWLRLPALGRPREPPRSRREQRLQPDLRPRQRLRRSQQPLLRLSSNRSLAESKRPPKGGRLHLISRISGLIFADAQNREKCLLRNIDPPDTFHAFLAFFLLLEQ